MSITRALVAAYLVCGVAAAAGETQWTASRYQGEKYAPGQAADGQQKTAWAADNRPPVWIQATFDRPQWVSRVRVRQVDSPRLYSNARRTAFSFSDGTTFSCVLPDTAGEITVSFPRVRTAWLRMTIESAYRVTYYVGLRELVIDDAGLVSKLSVVGQVSNLSSPVAKPLAPPARTAQDPTDVIARLSPNRPTGAHPTLFMNADDLERAKKNVRRHTWARRVFSRILDAADRFAAMSDDQLRAIVPPRGAAFDSKAQCPYCGRGCIARLDRIRQATCGGCAKTLPDTQHPDDGHGWKNPQTGETHNFVALYNSVAVDRITDAAADLSQAYALTRDERYAHSLSVALDGLAAIYPSCDKGPIWYPGVGGRLNRPFYQTARTLIYYAREYDLTFDSPEWDRPSCDPAMPTRRASYEKNLLRNGADYCFAEVLKQPIPGLHNGNCDYLQGALAVGQVLGVPKFLDYMLHSDLSIFNFLENTIDRDGQYYETSLGYSAWATELFGHHAEILRNDRGPAGAKPVNLYDHPKLKMNYLRAETDVDCAGHQPALGDAGPEISVLDESTLRPMSRLAYDRLEILAARTSDPAARAEAFRRIRQYAGGDLDRCREQSPIARWLLFHAAEIPEGQADEKGDSPHLCEAPFGPFRQMGTVPFFGSTLLAGGRGIAILRSGTPESGRRCALVRYGPTLNHGSPDELNVNFFALGREITFDQGYGWAHHRCGWAHSTVAHNVVVVNQENQLPRADGSGGSLEQFCSSPSVRLVSADDPAAYAGQGVRRYRRLLALVDLSPSRSYLLDLFDVEGGKQHDLGHHFLGSLAQTEGIELGPPQTRGSLAGPEYEWWKLVEPSGWIRGSKERFYWNAPPGNGYGFLFDVQSAAIKTPAPRLIWKLGDRQARPENVFAVDPAACRIARPGDGVDFPAGVSAPGEYVVLVSVEKAPDRGRFVALVDGKPAGREVDAYSPVQYTPELVWCGRLALPAGPHSVRFQCTGKDAESAGHRLAIKQFALEPAAFCDHAGEPETEGVALTLLPPPQTQVVAAKAKGLAVAPTSNYIFLRRNGENLRSRFVSVIEPFAGRPEVLNLASDDRRVIRVDSTGARKDFFFDLSPGGGSISLTDAGIPIRFAGRAGIVRTRAGKPYEVLLSAAASLRFGELEIAVETDAYRGIVQAVDYERGIVSLDKPLPDAMAKSETLVYFSRTEYSRNAPYRVAGIRPGPRGSQLDLGGASLVLGRGRATSAVSPQGLVKNGVPLDRGRAYGRQARTRLFDGKAIRNLRSGETGQVRQVNLDSSIVLARNPGLRAGDRFELLDVQTGDTWEIPALVSLTERRAGDWTLSSNVPVQVKGNR